MKSPFPGMDPYLERSWRDVHARLVLYIADALQPSLPSDLLVRAEERIYVSSERAAKGYRNLYPDVRIVESDPLPFQPVASSLAVAVAEPLVIAVDDEPMTETYLQVKEVATERVVTTIEVLSTTNKKPGDGAREYRQKQQELEENEITLVEIDLLRGGQWVVRAPVGHLRPETVTAYKVCATRGWDPRHVLYYPIPLRARLPAIRIPLRETDDDVSLDLQALLDQVYRNGRYASIDYRRDANPPLTDDDAAWADELLRAAGKR
jgi:hypothetical protein